MCEQENGKTKGEIGNSPIGEVVDLIHRRKDLRGARTGHRAVCRRSNDKRSPNTEGQGQPRGGRQQVTTDIHEQQPWALLLPFPPSLSVSLSRLFLSLFLSLLSSWLSTSQSFSNRYIDRSRKPDVMSSTRESRNVRMSGRGEEGNRRAIADPLPYVGCGRPRTSVHPSFVPFEGLPSIASSFYPGERTMTVHRKWNIVLRVVRNALSFQSILGALPSFWRCISSSQ